MSATKMNSFLQRMLKKNSNEELNAYNQLLDKEHRNQKPEPGRALPTKGTWIGKLGNYSPNKYQVPGSSPARMTRLKPVDPDILYSANQITSPRGTSRSRSSPTTPLDMPDLETIIRDFEMGFRSPSKNGAPKSVDALKQQQKNFVKKIVAAFEVKYKTYNDPKTSQEAGEAEETCKRSKCSETKRRSGLFSSPFRSGSEEFRNDGKPYDTTQESPEKSSKLSGVFSTPSKYSVEDSKAFRRSGVYGSPFRFSDDEGTCQDPADESKYAEEEGSIISTPSKKVTEESKVNARRSAIFSPLDNSKDNSKESIKSDIYSSPLRFDSQESKDSSSDSSSLFKFDKEESKRRNNVSYDHLRVSSLDDTKTFDSIELDVTLPDPDETIFLDDHALRKTSTMIDEYDRPKEFVNDPPRVSRADKTPKIVGAFLKKPIEVEDTSIEWIPITGKKLPRKRSLKKLLTSWATKRTYDKKNSLYSSERNLNEETRELQDSGYDEKSCSSSSLTSLISITEALLLQENSYVEPNRRTTFKTFHSTKSLDDEEDKALRDTCHSARKRATKLLLTEVPREQVKMDLGPIYPSPKVLTMSLDRRTTTAKKPTTSPETTTKPPLIRLPKHPHLSSIPKHPFVALTKLDVPEYEEPVIIKNGLYEVEFRKSCTDIDPGNASRDSSSSSESNYDVPRSFLSKSETQIPQACQVEFRRSRKPVYDVPRRRCQERSRSSICEDSLSMKRKNARTVEQQPLSEFYSVASDTEPHYATVKPIYNRLYHSREMLLSSVQDIASMENMSEF